jgi:hypothetical protein
LDFLVAYTLGWLPSMPGWMLVSAVFFSSGHFYFTPSFSASVRRDTDRKPPIGTGSEKLVGAKPTRVRRLAGSSYQFCA